MAAPDPILVDRRPDGVAVVRVNRPQVHNAFDWRAMEAFARVVAHLAAETAVPGDGPRVVVICGAGSEAFSSGGDLRALRTAAGRGDGLRLASIMGDALKALEQLPIPVLAAINGYAVGGGAELALACDLRLADAGAKMGLVHLRLAEVPAWGGATRLTRLVGYSRAMRMLLEAETYEADELYRMGVVDFVVAAGSALPAAQKMASQLAAADPAAVRAVKSIVRVARDRGCDAAMSLEREAFADLWPAPAHLAALEAFGSGAPRPGRQASGKGRR